MTTDRLDTHTHTVVSGDTLWRIAEKYYGNGAEWPRILEANSEVIASAAEDNRLGEEHRANPGHWIFPGTVLAL